MQQSWDISLLPGCLYEVQFFYDCLFWCFPSVIVPQYPLYIYIYVYTWLSFMVLFCALYAWTKAWTLADSQNFLVRQRRNRVWGVSQVNMGNNQADFEQSFSSTFSSLQTHFHFEMSESFVLGLPKQEPRTTRERRIMQEAMGKAVAAPCPMDFPTSFCLPVPYGFLV